MRRWVASPRIPSTTTPACCFPFPGRPTALLGLDDAALPFEGEDEWHAFELSWLDAKGKPIVAVARFQLPADYTC